MSVFIDTGVFYAHHDTDASRHAVGAEALTEVLRSPEYGRVMTSDYIYDEAVTLTQMRTGDVEAGLELGRRIRGDGYPSAIELLYSLRRLFDRAVTIQQTYADHGLSFTGGTRRMPRPLRSGRKPTIDDTTHATMAN